MRIWFKHRFQSTNALNFLFFTICSTALIISCILLASNCLLLSLTNTCISIVMSLWLHLNVNLILAMYCTVKILYSISPTGTVVSVYYIYWLLIHVLVHKLVLPIIREALFTWFLWWTGFWISKLTCSSWTMSINYWISDRTTWVYLST